MDFHQHSNGWFENKTQNVIPFSQLMLKIGYPDIGQVICNCWPARAIILGVFLATGSPKMHINLIKTKSINYLNVKLYKINIIQYINYILYIYKRYRICYYLTNNTNENNKCKCNLTILLLHHKKKKEK